jgi:hypothetical protein
MNSRRFLSNMGLLPSGRRPNNDSTSRRGRRLLRCGIFDPTYDRSGSKADLTRSLGDVSFTPESGQRMRRSACPLSASSGLMHRSKQHAEQTHPLILFCSFMAWPVFRFVCWPIDYRALFHSE